MSGFNRQSFLYYYYCIRIKVAFACSTLRKKRRHRNNIKFYHIPYRIAHEEMIALSNLQLALSVINLQNKILIYPLETTINFLILHIQNLDNKKILRFHLESFVRESSIRDHQITLIFITFLLQRFYYILIENFTTEAFI